MPTIAIPQKLLKDLETLATVTISAHITPKSQQNQLVDSNIDSTGKISLKLKIRGVPEKGLVNEELINFLSKLLNLPKSHIEITSGLTGRHKIIRLTK